MSRSRRFTRPLPTDLRPRLVLLLGGAMLLVAFLFPRWYVNYGGGWQKPTPSSPNRALIFFGPKAPIQTMRTAKSRGELVSIRMGKVVAATPDWRRAFTEAFFIALGTGALWFFYKSRGRRAYASTSESHHPR